MGVAPIRGVRAADAGGERRSERDHPGRVDRQQDPRGLRRGFANRLVVAGEAVDDPPGHRGEIHPRGGDEGIGRRRRPPGAVGIAGGERYELVQDGGEVVGPQLRLQDGHQAPRGGRPVQPEDGEGSVEGTPRGTPAGADQGAERLEGGAVGRVGRQLEQAVDQDRAEQLGGAPGRVEHPPGGALLLAGQRLGARVRAVDAVHRGRQLPGDVPLAGHGLPAAAEALAVAASALLRGLPLGRLPRLPRGGPRRGDGGQAGQLAGAVPVRAADAVDLVKRQRELQRIMPLGVRGRSVLTAHLHEAHREPQHAAGHAVTTDQLDARMATVATGELDGFLVRPSPSDRLVELLAHAVQYTRDRRFG
jgi:hypothetical protein